MKARAIALLSGGLDSTLACYLIKKQNIELEAVNFVTIFCTCTSKDSSCLASQRAADQLGIKLKVFNISEEYLEVIREPKYGYGKNMNPCIDCRIFMFKKAKRYMEESEADFVITGEVLGERPMSQHMRAMRIVEKEAGLQGLILRPLSAKFFPKTEPEKKGIIDRERLLKFCGRSRKPQIKLANEIGIKEYPCSGGGCLLTDFNFSVKLKDLLTHGIFDFENARLLKIGRHFRLSKNTKLVIGRNEEENKILATFLGNGDICLKNENFAGPVSLLRGNIEDGLIELSAMLTAAFGKGKSEPLVSVVYWGSHSKENIIKVKPLGREKISIYKIGG
ncbi:MAG: hypothetical protein FJZ16_02705 [Candidatus Omnitrophica bacterium]|nr:hypothetical protein [Candidatus Omnitrophota bacterium]